MSRKLSDAQVAMLRRIARHGDPWRGSNDKWTSNGRGRTLRVLQRMNLIKVGAFAHGGFALTVDGFSMLRIGRSR